MARTLQKEVSKNYHIDTVDCDIEVIETTRVNVLDWIDGIVDCVEMINAGCTNCDCSDMSAVILYKDGTYDFINEDYDGHKIRRTNIEAAMYDDGYVTYVFGQYEVNEYGVVTI